MRIGRVAQLFVYPVKSFAGVEVEALEVGPAGPAGDRAWGVYDPEADVVLSAKRVGELLDARVEGDEAVLPTGERGRLGDTALDAALSAWLGRTVRVVHVDDEPTLRQEMHRDNEDLSSAVIRWRTPRGRYVDLFPLHLLLTSTVATLATTHRELDWDVRRFRPNVLIETDCGEDELLTRTLRIGGAVIVVPDQHTERCVMVTREQQALPRQRSSLRAIARARRDYEGPLTAGSAKAVLGCYGEVRVPGTIRAGDAVELLDE
jgi:uncharacterized protein YcbX